MPPILRRFLLWTLICVVSAAPSFLWAKNQFRRDAIAVGVILFIFAYTALTSTRFFERFHNLPFIRRTLYIGYSLRLLLSLAFPIGMAADVWPGVVSIGVVDAIGIMPDTFAGTLAVTIVQGTLLNAILFVFMLIVYAIQRAFLKPPMQLRGFEVVLPVQPIPQSPATENL